MREGVTDRRPARWPSVESLRAQCDAIIREKLGVSRSAALRRVDLSHTTFERLLREGVSENGSKSVERKLVALGVIGLIPRR